MVAGHAPSAAVAPNGRYASPRRRIRSLATPVVLKLEQTNFTLGMAIGYLLPAVTLLLGAALLSFAGDAAAALGAAIGLTTGLFLVRLLHRRLFADRVQPAASVTCPSQSFPGESP